MKLLKEFAFCYLLALGFSIGWQGGKWVVDQPDFFTFYLPITCALMVPVVFAIKNKLTELFK